MFGSDDSKNNQNAQDANDLQKLLRHFAPPTNDLQKLLPPFCTFCTPFELVSKPRREGFYTAADVAKILGVTRQAVEYWRKKGFFTEDVLDHNSIYLYSKERVEQLKSVYHKGWAKAWAKGDKLPTNNQPTTTQPIGTQTSQLSNAAPQVIEMEKFVLGAMLLKDGAIIPTVSAILDTEDFYRPEHRLIYQAILKIYKKNVIPNVLSLVEELRSVNDGKGQSLLDKISLTYILGIVEIAHTTAFAETYARTIKDKSDLRKLQAIALKIATDAESEAKSALDIIAETNAAFNGFSDHSGEAFFNIGDYIASDFGAETAADRDFLFRKTGFANIDAHQIFRPGLYILGATPACGKTTFAWQLAEQLAERGEYCIFCSYEMNRKELAAKSLARKIFIRNPRTSLISSQIRHGATGQSLRDIAAEFKAAKLNFTLRKFSTETVDKVLSILRPLCADADKPPIVFIDYLQRLIQRDGKADTRALVDDALYKLKNFQEQTNVTFVVVSTFNRTNYNLPVSFECFKESGGIEYTADVVWALQLNVANKLSGEKEGVIRQKIESAKIQQPRHINLRCLKNRHGNNYDVFFRYFSAHDYFKPCAESDFVNNSNDSAEDDVQEQ